MEFSILGQTVLTSAGEDVSLGSAKQRGLLALLLYHIGTAVRLDTIVEHLWEGRTVSDCRPNLYVLASRIRRILRRVGESDALVLVPSGIAYRLDLDPQLVDYHRFRALVTRARHVAGEGRPEECVVLLTDALALWRDEPLADLRGSRSEAIRQTMNSSLLNAHRLLADTQLSIGQYDAVLARLEPVVAANKLDEALARSWIAALQSGGRNDDARSFALDFRQRFRRAMRMEPNIDPPYSGRPATSPRGSHDNAVTSGDPPDQLVRDIDDFMGRTDALAQLDQLTQISGPRASAVVLSGMPGVGKTTLAVHWAHRERSKYPHGQLYLNADAYGATPPVDPAEALGRFLRALGIAPGRVPPALDQRRELFNQVLANRRVLIVLDNVLNSDQARPLITTSKTCLTVITSRNRLQGLAIREGVRSITVGPLSGDESFGLLRQVIGTNRVAREAPATQALARVSGGLPLALRIIGEHVAERALAKVADLVAELAAHLLDYEGDDDQGVTLRNVFAWSYDALEPEVARLFRLIGLFPGRSVSAPAASVLLNTHRTRAEGLLNTLARAHLVSHHTAGRYRCHDLIRLYAEDRLHHHDSPAAQREVQRRLFDWYLLSTANAAALLAPNRSPVPDLPPPDGIVALTFASGHEAMAWIEAERANLHAVVRVAAERGFHTRVWQLAGAVHEILERYGPQDDVIDIHLLALAASRADGHEVGQIGTLNNLGTTYFAVHNYELAAAYFTTGLELARRNDYIAAVASCSYNLASVHLKSGDAARAIRNYRQVLSLCRDVADPHGEASVLHKLGDAYLQVGELDLSLQHYREALTIRERTGALRGQAATHGQIAAFHLRLGRPGEALRHCAAALDIHATVTDEASRCDCLTTTADAARMIGKYTDAVQYAYDAAALAEKMVDSLRRARALAVLAETLFAVSDDEGARRQANLALRIVGDDHEGRILRRRLITLWHEMPRRQLER